jgi:hypothetical protein
MRTLLMVNLCTETLKTLLTVRILLLIIYEVTTKWQSHHSTKVDQLAKDFKALNKISIKEYATTAHVII